MTSVTELTFQPDEMLELGSTYQVVLDAEKALSATGRNAASKARQSTFTTVPYPAIVGTSPVDGETERLPLRRVYDLLQHADGPGLAGR